VIGPTPGIVCNRRGGYSGSLNSTLIDRHNCNPPVGAQPAPFAAKGGDADSAAPQRPALDADDARAARAAFRPETGLLAVSRGRGGAGTPVVLLHGFASDATSKARLEAHLRDRPVIRIDLPAHGKSPKRAADSFADLVRDVRHALDGLSLCSAHLVGHSLGGAVALALADTRPDRIAGLTLIAPAGLGPEIGGAVLRGICNATRAASLDPWLRSLVSDEAIVTDSYVRLAMAARADARLRAAQAALAEALFPDGVQAFDLRAALDRVAAPARIVWGRHDAIIPWTHALRAPGRVALHLFDGIGHMPQIECPEAVAAILQPDA
jgi:pyruvate dehydrogenase E2 component (dihydrolipoamide acetyltransferase)